MKKKIEDIRLKEFLDRWNIKSLKSCTEKHIRNIGGTLWKEIMEEERGESFSEKLYLYIHKDKKEEIGRCKKCGNKTTFVNIREGYHEFCSVKCSVEGAMEKRKETMKRKYGQEWWNNKEKARKTIEERGKKELTEEEKEERKRKRVEKWGSYNNIEKAKETKKERYGEEEWNNKEKIKKTKKERYGEEGWNNREKAKKTCKEKWGVDNPFKSEEVKAHIRQTMMERWGTEWASQSMVLMEKKKENCKKRWGKEWSVQREDVKEKIKKGIHKGTVERWEGLKEIVSDEDWIMECPHPGCEKCKEKCYHISRSMFYTRRALNIEPCTHLLPSQTLRQKDTYIELFIQNILDQQNIPYEKNTRAVIPPLEVDIWIPSKNIAIECNGVYFHSDRMVDKEYHMKKWKLCTEKGIQLISVWEDWIRRKPEIVKSLILNKLGLCKKSFYARLCEVREVSSKGTSTFLEENHIQGKTKTKVRIGLFYDNELMGVMTFMKPSRYSGTNKEEENGVWELNRFCTKRGERVVGGGGKMLSYFIKKYKPKKIYSFASNDISNGRVYERLGFKERGGVTRCYWYVEKNSMIRYHRSSFSKEGLKRRGIEVGDRTEKEIMDGMEGMCRVWDSGHRRYELIV